VRLRGSKLPENLSFLDDSILDDIDARCLASMDGPRVNKFIKNHIAKQHLTLFQHCLQCIKHWASERDIYNKPTGYLNGGSWTLLLLKTYMTESAKAQDLTITHILREFFETWSNWPWPTPVLLTDFIPGKDGEHLSFHSLSELATSVMPIVSPCYPVCSVAPFVTKSTLKIMTREFQRGNK
jgi:poly(A) polymerase